MNSEKDGAREELRREVCECELLGQKYFPKTEKSAGGHSDEVNAAREHRSVKLRTTSLCAMLLINESRTIRQGTDG